MHGFKTMLSGVGDEGFFEVGEEETSMVRLSGPMAVELEEFVMASLTQGI